jgi:hypothetical protein
MLLVDELSVADHQHSIDLGRRPGCETGPDAAERRRVEADRSGCRHLPSVLRRRRRAAINRGIHLRNRGERGEHEQEGKEKGWHQASSGWAHR